ncbi:MAG: putative PEP-binding protein [Geminicoccaceae bacterium]
MKTVRRRVLELREANPMLGLRGCRLAILYPEITEMQARAIFEATVEVHKKSGDTVIPEVMIPLIATQRELDILKERIDAVAEEVRKETGSKVEYLVGTMIELPRAALCAGEIANSAEFFSFGTNDLTQMALGLSRDDAGSFLEQYVRAEIYAGDPFQTIDRVGVGELVRIGVERGRGARRSQARHLRRAWRRSGLGRVLSEVGLDYVSCSPYRVPIARLAAAQAALRD